MSCASYFLPPSRNDEKSRGEIDDDGGPSEEREEKEEGVYCRPQLIFREKEGEGEAFSTSLDGC